MSKQGGELTITADEQKELDYHVKVVTDGQQTFIEVGKSLAAIRDGKLYRAKDNTFEAFCERIWGFKRTYAHRLIEAAGITETLPMGNKPTTERQVRELKKAPPEKRAEAWKEASKNGDGKPTAVEVRRAVEKVAPSIREAITKPVADDEPWNDYNAKINALCSTIEQAATLTRELVAMAPFADWVNAKEYKTFWSNTQVNFEKHLIIGWADRSQLGKGKAVVYAFEQKKGAKK